MVVSGAAAAAYAPAASPLWEEGMMRAADVMSDRVFKVRAEMSVAELAQLLVERQISAVPVVDADDRVLGIITERDLMRRVEIGTAQPPADEAERFSERTSRAAAYVKAHATTAGEIMTPRVLTVTKDTPLLEIADLMERWRIKRVPVVEAGRLVGIVSRLDLVRALCIQNLNRSASPLSDEEISAKLRAEIERERWQLGADSKIIVFEGVVHLFGTITSVQEAKALVAAAKSLPGVREVQNHLAVAEPRIEFV
jgi:CBS domain-containing protein